MLWGTIKTFNTKPAPVHFTTTPPFYISNVSDPEPPSPKYPSLESCQSPKLKGTHFYEGETEVRGQRLTAIL